MGVDPDAIVGAMFITACLVVAGIFAALAGLCWLAYYLWCHVDIRWIP